jgi:flagellar FliJ protein
MAKFVYKMAGILDIKLKMEDQARTAFAQAMANLNTEEEKLDELVFRKQDYENKGRMLRSKKLDVFELKENERAIENLKGQIEDQKERVKEAEELVEQARKKLNEAIQERKIHEKLKENAFEEFKKEVNAAESKEIDELVSYRFGLKANQDDE